MSSEAQDVVDCNDGNTERGVVEVQDGKTTTTTITATDKQETDTESNWNSQLLTTLAEIKAKLDETLSAYEIAS